MAIDQSARTRADAPQARVLLLGPDLGALSGVSSHLRTLFGSALARRFELGHFRIGSEGRAEGRWARRVRLLLSPPTLLLRLLARRPAIVHINTSLNTGAFWRDLAYMAVARACGIAVLLQVHGGALPQDFQRGALMRRVLRAALQWPAAVVVLARRELDAYRRFVPRQDVRLIPNAVDCPAITCGAGSTGTLRLLYIGRLAGEKGLFDLLHALRLAVARGARHRLTIAGDGPDAAALRECIAAAGLAAHVQLVGPARGAARDALLAQADVFVLASHGEGLPYALLEAMAAGLPVLATPVGAIPDVVDDGVHGLLVPARDPAALAQALARLAGMDLRRMGAAGRERIAQRYTIAGLSEALGTLYADLLARQRA